MVKASCRAVPATAKPAWDAAPLSLVPCDDRTYPRPRRPRHRVSPRHTARSEHDRSRPASPFGPQAPGSRLPASRSAPDRSEDGVASGGCGRWRARSGPQPSAQAMPTTRRTSTWRPRLSLSVAAMWSNGSRRPLGPSRPRRPGESPVRSGHAPSRPRRAGRGHWIRSGKSGRTSMQFWRVKDGDPTFGVAGAGE